MNILALDYGEKRVGLAVGNSTLKTSTPIKSIMNKDRTSLLTDLKKIIFEYEIKIILIGHPINMNDTKSPLSKKVVKFMNKIKAETGLETKLVDERLTSFESEEMLKDIHTDYKKRKKFIDSLSAHILLTDYLEQK